MVKPCQECGTDVQRADPEEGRWAELLARAPVTCSRCIERVEAEEAEQHRADVQRCVEDGLRRVMPPELLGLSLDDIDETPERESALVGARRWASSEIRGLILSGPVGVGKTRLAAAAARERALANPPSSAHPWHRPLYWTSAPLLFARLGSGFGSRDRQDAIENLMGTACMVLDDLDKARPTEFGAEQIFLAIDQRVTAGAPLLVTLNLSSDELREKFPEPYGEAIASRLLGYCEGFRIAGADRRVAGV